MLLLVLVALDKDDLRIKVHGAGTGQTVFCAAKELATYLPQIVPKLDRVLQDLKNEVTAALQNVRRSVVRNPEIASLPLLIEATIKGA